MVNRGTAVMEMATANVAPVNAIKGEAAADLTVARVDPAAGLAGADRRDPVEVPAGLSDLLTMPWSSTPTRMEN